jgi:hypothetical protein
MARKQPRTQQPFLDHETLTQGQQAKFLGHKPETVMNLGHPTTVDRLTENPVGRPLDYENDAAARITNETRSVGVYGKFRDPQSGISTNEQNLNRWADYARSNSYHRGPGPGKEPTMRDPRGTTVPSAARTKDSDGHLAPLPSASTENWADYSAGADSGEGRLEKIHRK